MTSDIFNQHVQLLKAQQLGLSNIQRDEKPMTDTKHTPTPRIKGPCQQDNNFQKGYTLKLDDSGKVLAILTREGEKFAPSFVRACNAHDDLVAALEYVQSVARDAGLQSFGLDTKYIDSVLAKAKGGQ